MTVPVLPLTPGDVEGQLSTSLSKELCLSRAAKSHGRPGLVGSDNRAALHCYESTSLTAEFLRLIKVGTCGAQAANAQHNFHKSKVVHHKIKYKVQIHKSGKVCDILNRKRHYVPKAPLFASNRKPKSKPLAELDAPRVVASMN